MGADIELKTRLCVRVCECGTAALIKLRRQAGGEEEAAEEERGEEEAGPIGEFFLGIQ